MKHRSCVKRGTTSSLANTWIGIWWQPDAATRTRPRREKKKNSPLFSTRGRQPTWRYGWLIRSFQGSKPRGLYLFYLILLVWKRPKTLKVTFNFCKYLRIIPYLVISHSLWEYEALQDDACFVNFHYHRVSLPIWHWLHAELDRKK